MPICSPPLLGENIFLDTGSLDEIRQAADFGVVDGVTTNPTLAAKDGRPFRELILEMCRLLKDGVVNAEVGDDVEVMRDLQDQADGPTERRIIIYY